MEFVDRFLFEKKPGQQNQELDGKDKACLFIKMFLRETVFGGPGESGGSRGGGTARRLPLLVGLADLRRAPRRLPAHTYRFLSTIIPLSAPAVIAAECGRARDRTTGEDGRSVSVECEAFTPARPPHRTGNEMLMKQHMTMSERKSCRMFCYEHARRSETHSHFPIPSLKSS